MGTFDQFVRLASAGIDIQNRNGETSLHIAVLYSNEMAVEVLLNCNANPSIQTEDGYTPLHFAVRQQKDNMVRLLLEHNVDTMLRNSDQKTALELAQLSGGQRILNCLTDDAALRDWLVSLDMVELLPVCRRHHITLPDIRDGLVSDDMWKQIGVTELSNRQRLLKPSVIGDLNRLREKLSRSMAVTASSRDTDLLNESQKSLVFLGLDPDLVLEYSDIRFVGQLGSGQFGTVRQADWQGTTVAVKTLLSHEFESQNELAMFLKEVSILSKLRFKYVIQFFGVSLSPSGEYCIVSEYMQGGSLMDVYRRCRESKDGALDDALRNSWAEQIARGMLYLHSKSPPILHRDLHPGNVLIDDHNVAKISDFGVSKEKMPDTKDDRSMGSLQWMSPEVIKGREYTEAADVYSFGMVLWSLFSMTNPASGRDPMEYVASLVKFGDRPSCDGVPAFYRHLIMLAWSQTHTQRPTMRSIVQYLHLLPSLESANVIPENWNEILMGSDRGRKPDSGRGSDEAGAHASSAEDSADDASTTLGLSSHVNLVVRGEYVIDGAALKGGSRKKSHRSKSSTSKEKEKSSPHALAPHPDQQEKSPRSKRKSRARSSSRSPVLGESPPPAPVAAAVSPRSSAQSSSSESDDGY